MSELKRCPFCGGEAKINDTRAGGSVQACMIMIKCKSCKVKMDGSAPLIEGDKFHIEMINNWNRRADNG